jgi:hypothetical protein
MTYTPILSPPYLFAFSQQQQSESTSAFGVAVGVMSCRTFLPPTMMMEKQYQNIIDTDERSIEAGDWESNRENV